MQKTTRDTPVTAVKRLTARSRLPPLNALRAFDATARHLTVVKAADELNVTPSAVSHQLRTLEDAPGVQLFTRNKTRHIGEFLRSHPDVRFKLIPSNDDKEVYSPAVDPCIR